MKYNYIVENDSVFGLTILERGSNEFFSEKRRWRVSYLRDVTNISDNKSFQRTKKWLIENYPELLI
jgi:hypothetical protein